MTGILVTPDFILADGLTTSNDGIVQRDMPKIGTIRFAHCTHVYALMGDMSSALTVIELLQEADPQSVSEARKLELPVDDFSLIIVPDFQGPSFGYVVTPRGFEILPLSEHGKGRCFGSASDFLAGAYAVSDTGSAVMAASRSRTDFGGVVRVKRLGELHDIASFDTARHQARAINRYLKGNS